jgi:hypothetical protein
MVVSFSVMYERSFFFSNKCMNEVIDQLGSLCCLSHFLVLCSDVCHPAPATHFLGKKMISRLVCSHVVMCSICVMCSCALHFVHRVANSCALRPDLRGHVVGVCLHPLLLPPSLPCSGRSWLPGSLLAGLGRILQGEGRPVLRAQQ